MATVVVGIVVREGAITGVSSSGIARGNVLQGEDSPRNTIDDGSRTIPTRMAAAPAAAGTLQGSATTTGTENNRIKVEYRKSKQ